MPDASLLGPREVVQGKEQQMESGRREAEAEEDGNEAGSRGWANSFIFITYLPCLLFTAAMRPTRMLQLHEVEFPKDDGNIREEIVRMVLQWLSDEGYPLAMRTLADEHNLKEKQGQNSKRHLAQMRQALLKGEWGVVDKLIGKPVFKNQPEFYHAVFKQRYMELLEAGEHQKAYELIQQHLKPLEGQQPCTAEGELKELCFSLINRPEALLSQWDRSSERDKLVEAFPHLLGGEEYSRITDQAAGVQLENQRLLTLLHQVWRQCAGI